MDPWSAGGVTSQITGNDKITTIVIKNAAHHLELRAPNEKDGEDVVNARKVISDTIGKWISEYFTPLKYYQ